MHTIKRRRNSKGDNVQERDQEWSILSGNNVIRNIYEHIIFCQLQILLYLIVYALKIRYSMKLSYSIHLF